MIRSEITPSEQNFGLDVIVNLVVKSEEPKELRGREILNGPIRSAYLSAISSDLLSVWLIEYP